MKRIISVVLLALALIGIAFPATADSLVGKYDGSYIVGRGLNLGLRVEITDNDGTSVKGEAVFYQKFCGGSFPFEGKMAGDKMKLEVKGADGCDPRTFELQVKGEKLVGTLQRGPDTWDIEIRR